MSPKTKKILLIGGAAVAGLVAYKVIKGRASAKAPTAALSATRAQLMTKFASLPGVTFSKVAGIEEELGVAEDLGSLGGGWR